MGVASSVAFLDKVSGPSKVGVATVLEGVAPLLLLLPALYEQCVHYTMTVES